MLRFIILIDTALNLVLALSFAVMELQTFPPPHLPPYIATLILVSLLATRELYFYKQGELSESFFVFSILRTKARVRGYMLGS